MNTKSYVNYFAEIAHLEPEVQYELLERARWHASIAMGLSGKSALNFLVSLLAALLPPLIVIVVMHNTIPFFQLAIPTGIVGGLLLLRWLNGRLLRRGLVKVLEDRAAAEMQ